MSTYQDFYSCFLMSERWTFPHNDWVFRFLTWKQWSSCLLGLWPRPQWHHQIAQQKPNKAEMAHVRVNSQWMTPVFISSVSFECYTSLWCNMSSNKRRCSWMREREGKSPHSNLQHLPQRATCHDYCGRPLYSSQTPHHPGRRCHQQKTPQQVLAWGTQITPKYVVSNIYPSMSHKHQQFTNLHQSACFAAHVVV